MCSTSRDYDFYYARPHCQLRTLGHSEAGRGLRLLEEPKRQMSLQAAMNHFLPQLQALHEAISRRLGVFQPGENFRNSKEKAGILDSAFASFLQSPCTEPDLG